MSTTSKISASSRRIVQLNETTADEAGELLQALANTPPAPEAIALDYLLDGDVGLGSGD